MEFQTTIREATIYDLPVLVRHRRLMFESMGFSDQGRNDAMDASVRDYLNDALPTGQFRSWLATINGGEVVAGIGLQIIQLPGNPRTISGCYAYLMSLYVEPHFRRRGIARRLLDLTIVWARSQGLTEVRLHASDQGRPLYETLGFKPTSEMRLLLQN